MPTKLSRTNIALNKNKQVTDMSDEDLWAGWEELAYEYIVQSMRQGKLTYKDLSRLLSNHGIEESADQLNRKVNRRRFSAAFFFACMSAMGIEKLHLPSPKQVTQRIKSKAK